MNRRGPRLYRRVAAAASIILGAACSGSGVCCASVAAPRSLALPLPLETLFRVLQGWARAPGAAAAVSRDHRFLSTMDLRGFSASFPPFSSTPSRAYCMRAPPGAASFLSACAVRVVEVVWRGVVWFMQCCAAGALVPHYV